MGLLFSCWSIWQAPHTDFTSGFLEASLNVRESVEENGHTGLGSGRWEIWNNLLKFHKNVDEPLQFAATRRIATPKY